MEHKLLKTSEVAELLGLSVRTLEAWRVRGGGPRYISLSKRAVRYRADEIATFINEGSRANTSEAGR